MPEDLWKEQPSFKELIDIDKWQQIQYLFSEVLGITLKTIDLEGKLLTQPSRPTPFCQELASRSDISSQICLNCMSDAIKMYKLETEPIICKLGLYTFLVPITVVNNKKIAFIFVGPVMLGQRHSTQDYVNLAKRLNVSLDELRGFLQEVNLFSFVSIDYIIRLLKDVAHYFAQLGYQRFRMKQILPELLEVDKSFRSFYMDKLLITLLEVSSSATDAEFGSVMLLDSETKQLYIKIAHGISEDIRKTTRVKLGEGISGFVAQHRRPLLLHDQIEDRQIKSRFKKPHLGSAIVAPLQVEESLLGVLSISRGRNKPLLEEENLQLILQLIKLTGIAIEGINRGG